jgi:hypothetical protein
MKMERALRAAADGSDSDSVVVDSVGGSNLHEDSGPVVVGVDLRLHNNQQ